MWLCAHMCECMGVRVCVCVILCQHNHSFLFVFEMLKPNKMGTRNFFRLLIPAQGLHSHCVEFSKDGQTDRLTNH